jgi:hypothetical protein
MATAHYRHSEREFAEAVVFFRLPFSPDREDIYFNPVWRIRAGRNQKCRQVLLSWKLAPERRQRCGGAGAVVVWRWELAGKNLISSSPDEDPLPATA